ncbi:MAG: hypothetical protein ACFFDH_12895 [Promethearchaeota archaeon]
MLRIKIKKPTLVVNPDTRNFLIAFIITGLLTFALTYIEIWQLIIIPGIIGGLFNKSMRRGIYCGALGVSLVWIFYLIYLMTVKNFYLNLDQFAGLIFGGLGYGSIILILIILFGFLFGALGGAIGSGIMLIIIPRFEELSKRDIKSEETARNSNH